jgi:thiol-disulfide isomerase/thioredoxin
MNKKNKVVILLALLLAVLAIYRNSDNSDKETMLNGHASTRLHAPAPAFSLKALDGAVYQVGGKREKPLFLNFWASWCGPCEEEAPELSRLYEKYKSQLDLYAVNVTGNDDLEAAKAFAERFKFGFPVLLDEQLDAAKLYRFQVIPTSFLIDRNGVVVDVINLLEPPELEKKIKKLVDGE